jgi:hypothetical protein
MHDMRSARRLNLAHFRLYWFILWRELQFYIMDKKREWLWLEPEIANFAGLIQQHRTT